jgi:hypothetical protein
MRPSAPPPMPPPQRQPYFEGQQSPQLPGVSWARPRPVF